MVLDVKNGSAANMTPVQLWAHPSGAYPLNQQWFLWGKWQDGNGNWGYEIRSKVSSNPKCLDRRADLGLGNGNVVQIYDCNGLTNQAWWPVTVGTSKWVLLKNGADGRCLDVRDASYGNGAPLQVWSCSSGNWNQRWNIYP
ncbi:RICIN domain-containing protein [Micromonospora sp. NPDC048999]|uniref:RICIN domain-containing protein n=1 Tax=Micromonospora sp. NPDC048999 TaxID=3155391 RepID=UPI0033EB6199